MSDEPTIRHLSADRIQALLDGELPSREATAAEEHASSCARCRSELVAWRLVYAELGELPRVEPSAEFRERVLAEVNVGVPILERLKGWLGARRKAAAGTLGHLSPERLQDYVEGLLPAGQMARVESHLDACDRCRRQEAVWRSLVGGLESLPGLQPSPAFAARVMAAVRVPEPLAAGAPSSERRTAAALGTWLDALRPLGAAVVAMGRRLQPRTRRAWTLLGAAASAPAAMAMAAAWWVASNPLLSAGSLLTFLRWKVSEAGGALGRGLASAFLDSSLATQGYALAEQVGGSTSTVAGGVAVFCVLTVLSLFVLYRNVIATRPVEHGHVHFSF